jgi:hypothetical protein
VPARTATALEKGRNRERCRQLPLCSGCAAVPETAHTTFTRRLRRTSDRFSVALTQSPGPLAGSSMMPRHDRFAAILLKNSTSVRRSPHAARNDRADRSRSRDRHAVKGSRTLRNDVIRAADEFFNRIQRLPSLTDGSSITAIGQEPPFELSSRLADPDWTRTFALATPNDSSPQDRSFERFWTRLSASLSDGTLKRAKSGCALQRLLWPSRSPSEFTRVNSDYSSRSGFAKRLKRWCSSSTGTD